MKWNKYTKGLCITIGIFIACYLLGFLLNCLFAHNFNFILDGSLLFSGWTVLYAFLIFLIAFLFWLSYYYKHFWLKHSKRVMQGNRGDKRIDVCLEQAYFQPDKEINRNFTCVDFHDLERTNVVGIPIKAKQVGNRYPINFARPAHTLIIGTTGSGKTTSYIDPTIQILSESAAKPSLLITDPKGELYILHANSLAKRGYEVKVLDLRNPFNSVKWNPLERAYRMYDRMLHLEGEIKADEENGCFVFDGKEYYEPDKMDAAIQVKKQQLFDQVYEDLHDIITVLCPITNKNEPIWESGAKNFILAIAIAMLEDMKTPELGMTKDKYNFYNLTKIATNTEDDCEELIKYFKERGNLSKALSLSKQVLDAAEKTRGSYISTMFDKLNMFADLSLCAMTSENEITFEEMADRPIALFLQIPDEKETRHTLAAMVLLQAYKELVQKANAYPDLSLPHSVFFLMEEFGNLPPIHKLEQMITVGRSRNIWLNLVVQSYAQLAKVYDDKVAEIIKSNCNIQIFIGTTDLKTIEDFSKRCGNYTVITRNVGYNTVKAEDINSNASVKERPLIYPSELAQLNRPGAMGNAIVTVFGYMPIRSYFTPRYECTAYTLEKTVQHLGTGKYFDEENVFYDMKRRNKLMLPAKPVPGKRHANMSAAREADSELFEIKEIVERHITCELISDQEKIQLLNHIDNNRFTAALAIMDKAVRQANILSPHISDTLELAHSKLQKIEQLMSISARQIVNEIGENYK